MPQPAHAQVDVFEIIQQERKDSAKERKELQKGFLEAIKNQTESQNLALKTLGDRIERQMDSMRSDVRSSTNRIFFSFVIAMLVLASLAGVAVKYKGLELSPSGPTHEAASKSDHK